MPATKASTREPARSARTPVRSSDPRSVRSRDALRAALLRLVETRLFEKITVREITAEAGVSYPTFFNNYGSKEELFQDIARTEIIDLLAAFRHGRRAPDWRPGRGICAHIVARRSLWRTLLTTGASEAMRSEFIQRGRAIAGDRPTLKHGAPMDVVSGVIASGIFEIIAWWLAQEADFSAEAVAGMLESIVIEPALGLPPGYFTSRNAGQDSAG